MNKITIIDYGLSNLLSVVRAFDMFADDVIVTNDFRKVGMASKIVLPGVGAFESGMKGIIKYGLDEILIKCKEKQVPILGICLGMQMLFDKSFENGEYEGLGLISGTVEKLPYNTLYGERQNVPQIGWSTLEFLMMGRYGSNKLLEGIIPGDDVYFVHSYECKPYSQSDVIAYTCYGGRKVCAIAGYENIYGCQFHPEKSGKTGLKISKNFCLL